MDFLILLLLFKGTFFSFDHPTFIWVKSESSLPNTFLQHDDNDVVRAHLLLKSSQLTEVLPAWQNALWTILNPKCAKKKFGHF